MQRFALAIIAMSFALTASALKRTQDIQELQDEEDNKLISMKQHAFKPGERLTYRLTYGVFDAGEATLSVVETKKTVKGRKLWRMIGQGRTVSAFEWFYKIDDLYESYMDVKAMVPWVFKRRVDEGSHKINQDYTFFQH